MPFPIFWRWPRESPAECRWARRWRAPELMTWPPGAHASTFGGNPVACAAALTTIALLEEELVENAARMGAHLMDRMRDWPARFPIVGDVRGLGLMIGVELVRDQQTREKAPRLRDQVEELAFERGLLVLGAGDNTLRLCPPLVITRDQCDFAIETLEECSEDGHRQTDENTRRRLRDSQAARFHRARPESRQPRRRPGGPGPFSLPFRRQLLRPPDRHSRHRARGRCDPHHGGVPPPGARRRHGAHRDAALYRLQLVLRPHPQEPPQQFQLPLLRREPRRIRLLFAGKIS